MESAASQMLICRVGRALCSLPLTSVVETFRPLPIEPVAGGPDFVLGLAIVRGAPVPVVDLSLVLNGSARTPTRFIVVKTDDRRVVLAVDGVVGIRPIATERISALPPLLRDADRAVVSAVGTLDSALFMVLQASRLVPDGYFDESARRLAS